jgi:ABC-2 type transport system ATP-binding protein
LSDLQHLSSTAITVSFVGDAPRGLDQLPGVQDVTISDSKVSCRVIDTGYDSLIRALATTQITALSAQPPTLEEIFLRYYSADVRAESPT